MANRGDIFLVVIPFTDGSGAKLRPAVVVTSDAIPVQLDDITIAPVTTNTPRTGLLSTQVLIDLATPDGKSTGLIQTSVVRCERVTTVHNRLLRQFVGRVPPSLMARVDAASKVALELP
jgi:mRNA interferase MazF